MGSPVPEHSAQLLTDCFDVSRVDIAVPDTEEPSTSQLWEHLLRAFHHAFETVVKLKCFSPDPRSVGPSNEQSVAYQKVNRWSLTR